MTLPCGLDRVRSTGYDPALWVGQGQEYGLLPVFKKFQTGFCPVMARKGGYDLQGFSVRGVLTSNRGIAPGIRYSWV